MADPTPDVRLQRFQLCAGAPIVEIDASLLATACQGDAIRGEGDRILLTNGLYRPHDASGIGVAQVERVLRATGDDGTIIRRKEDDESPTAVDRKGGDPNSGGGAPDVDGPVVLGDG